MNRAWHEKNKMPEKATLEERVRWHTEHAKQCTCRPIPTKLSDKMKELKLKAE
jgi:hypothetical protein